MKIFVILDFESKMQVIAGINCFSTKKSMNISAWLTDWFERHINPSRVISYLEVRELRLLYIQIYIFCALVF